MKKVIISFLIIIFGILISFLYFSNTSKRVVLNTSTIAEENRLSPEYEPVSFSVIGDVHSDTTCLENAIKDLYDVNSDTDLMVMNGDIVDQGLPEHYTSVQSTIDSNKTMLPKCIINNIGNHEFFNYSKNAVLTPEESDEHILRHLEFAGEEKVYHDKWLKGYHFISMGSEQTNTENVGGVTAFISQDQLNWLEEKLAEDYKSGRPIFVFFHQPINNITPSKQNGWISSKQNVEVFNILSKYPEVVLFSSHTHTYLVSDNMVYLNNPFTALYTGAAHGPLKADENGKVGYSQESQGVYVEIIDSKLTIRGRDFGKKAWVEGAEFTRNLN